MIRSETGSAGASASASPLGVLDLKMAGHK